MNTVHSAVKQPAEYSQSKQLIDALQLRCKWPTVREALKSKNLPGGAGWKELQGNADDKGVSGEKLRTFLTQYYDESVIAAERHVRLYELDDPTRDILVKKLETSVVPASVFSQRYPFPLSQASLLAAPVDPTLVEIRRLKSNDFVLVFSSVRFYEDRIHHEYKNLPAHVKQTFQDVDQLIAVRKVYFQAYDTIVIRSSLSRIEVGVDQPYKSGNGNLDAIVSHLLGTARNYIPDLGAVYLANPINLIDAINGIYTNPVEGTVKEMSFRTLTGSRKHEKMTTSQDDLRSEAFHEAGAKAVGNEIRVYELVVAWSFTFPIGDAVVKLAARLRDLNAEVPYLHGCDVYGPDQASMIQAINKVVRYL